MLRQEILNRKKSMTDSTLYIIYFGIATRILVFIKGMLTASKIGVSYKMDSYLLALGAIMVLTSIIGDGLIVALVPLLQEVEDNYGLEGKIDYANNLINITIIISLVLILIGYILAPIIIRLYGPGFQGIKLEKAIDLFRIGLPIITLTWIRSIGGGYLQSEHAFRAGAKGGVANAIVYIIYLVFFSERFELKGLMLVGTISIIPQIYILIKTMKASGFYYKWKLDYKDIYLKEMVKTLFPILVGIGINQINWALDNAIASTQSLGSIAELNYANEVIELFLGLFIAAIVTVTFPVLAEDYNKKTCYIDGQCHDLNRELNYGIKLILSISVPVSIVLMTMADPIIQIFFERGAFGRSASFFTSGILGYYAIGLPAMAIIPLVSRAYYAIHDTKTPIIIAAIALPINIVLDLIFIRYMGTKGLALGTSISIILAAIYGIYNLNKTLQFTQDEPIVKTFIGTLVSGIAMGISIVFTYRTILNMLSPCLLNNIVIVGISSLIGIIVYRIMFRFIKLGL